MYRLSGALCAKAPGSGTGSELAVRQALADGGWNSLEGRWLSGYVRDIDLKWYTTVENEKLIVSQQADADVSLRRRQRSANDQLPISKDGCSSFSSVDWSLKAILSWGCISEESDGRHRSGQGRAKRYALCCCNWRILLRRSMKNSPETKTDLTQVNHAEFSEIPIDAHGIDALLRRSFRKRCGSEAGSRFA